MNEAKAEQKWEKGTPNGKGFFLLISSARKVLTATSADKLEIKGTGKSLSEALICASTNPQYDNRIC